MENSLKRKIHSIKIEQEVLFISKGYLVFSRWFVKAGIVIHSPNFSLICCAYVNLQYNITYRVVLINRVNFCLFLETAVGDFSTELIFLTGLNYIVYIYKKIDHVQE